jgi:hypothetical protein
MVRRSSCALVAAGLGALMLVGACGGSTSEESAEPIAHGSARSGVGPAAREVCSTMVRASVPASVGLPLVGEPVSSVRGDTFSCRYSFDGGTLDLSVRDLHTIRQAREYFRELRGRDGVDDTLSGLAAGGFTRADGSVVAMKDAMVLTVDATGLPPTGTERENVGIDVAATVLHCW